MVLATSAPPRPSHVGTYRLRLVADLGEGGLFGAARQQLRPTNQRQVLPDLVIRVALHRLPAESVGQRGSDGQNGQTGTQREWFR